MLLSIFFTGLLLSLVRLVNSFLERFRPDRMKRWLNNNVNIFYHHFCKVRVHLSLLFLLFLTFVAVAIGVDNSTGDSAF